MTALKREAIQLVEQMPEDQMPYVIQYIQTLKGKASGTEQLSSDEVTVTPKMSAFLELEKMLILTESHYIISVYIKFCFG